MRIHVRSPQFLYGCWDIFFALLYLFVFLVFLPSHRLLARFLTLFFPVLLGAGGLYLVFEGPRFRQVGFALGLLFFIICILLLAALGYVMGTFYGIYGPLGTGVGAIAAICAVQVVFLVGVWPVFQMRAFWPPKNG